MTHKMALGAVPLLHCHTDSAAGPSGRAISHGAAIGAPDRMHPARQPRRSALSWIGPGQCSQFVSATLPSEFARFARKFKQLVFCVGSFVSKSGFFCSPFLSVALMASAQSQPAHSWFPLKITPTGRAGASAFS
jgi:hypothetical protein